MRTEEEKWKYINELDERLLVGGVTLSEWSTFIIRDADLAFAKGANLAAILTCVAGIECHLRHENSAPEEDCKLTLRELIDKEAMDDTMRKELHELRKYRNRWVHVKDPWNDERLLDEPEVAEAELEAMAELAVKLLRQTIYLDQWL
ncbi:MAG: hypothetical protein JSV99_11860 [Planctomycetota bacterium]|nr:MAG: hypothetical protein JSV99_11860 [Planctomycetota bacterium]